MNITFISQHFMLSDDDEFLGSMTCAISEL